MSTEELSVLKDEGRDQFVHGRFKESIKYYDIILDQMDVFQKPLIRTPNGMARM